ncbi:MAG: hypothetical protein ACE5GE_01170 [Phycisphaerae bacterium]
MWIRYLLLGLAALLGASQPVRAQWFDLQDDPAISDATCGLINAENVRLVISDVDSSLVLVNGADRVLANTLVTSETQVFIDDQPVGFVEFATDQRGRRRVFWVTEIGSLYRLNPDGEPVATEVFPEEVTGDCDPCAELWDNPADCQDGVDDIPVDPVSDASTALVNSLCGSGSGTGLMGMLLALIPAIAKRHRYELR